MIFRIKIMKICKINWDLNEYNKNELSDNENTDNYILINQKDTIQIIDIFLFWAYVKKYFFLIIIFLN